MAKEIEQMNIFEKMSNITREIPTVGKNLEVGFGQNKYKAVSEADVLRAVKDVESKYRVYSYPFDRQIVDSGEIENAKGTKQLFERIRIVYRFVNMDKPEEYIDTISFGDGIDTQDKSVGKAMTYGDKYALLKAYKIATGEDPDQEASVPLNGVVAKKRYCQCCGKEIAENIYQYGMSTYKVAVCSKDCLKMVQGANDEH